MCVLCRGWGGREKDSHEGMEGGQREREEEDDEEEEERYMYSCGTHRVLLREFWNDAVSFVSIERTRLL